MNPANHVVVNALSMNDMVKRGNAVANIDYDSSEQEYIKSVRKMIPEFKRLAKKSVELKEKVKAKRDELRILEDEAMRAFDDALKYRNDSGFRNRRTGRFRSPEWKALEAEVEAIKFY